MNREYHRWYSHRLGRDMELLVFGHAGAKVLIFPTRDGRFYEYENLGLVQALAPKINAGQLQLYCLDNLAGETFYCHWRHPADRIQRHIQYEEYILQEVMPLMARKNHHPCTIAHGCSLGAYLATNLAFRHPHLFRKLCAFSGRYDLTHAVEFFSNLFEGYYDENIYFHTPLHYLPNLHREEHLHYLRNMDMVFTIGRDDPFYSSNRYLSQLLREKGIGHALHEWHGRAHRGRYWREMAPLFV
ncbi:Esterase/lipase superfamily enzyme [Catalinimonas alkaloidigena]|uniref:Esterase/lipase superfamily enzyme n=1 Tax=Catalinimonas alkaloidigena TaxID=1075417 RepID=A0A1G9SF60_9BACT|nr:alpha/beta hydrolase-fold protein [Catalinimonas alkaloidigena]SDM34042.1 Esterase/lipase superfamily enzyme [Catalinimonas alkaloidigena]